MKMLNSIEIYLGSMTSIIKLFIIYLLSKWYGISGYIFCFLFLRIYYIILNRLFKFDYISIFDQINILREIFSSKIKSKETIILEEEYDNFESLLNNIRENNIVIKYNNFFRTFVYKWNNFYWRQLNKNEISKAIIKGDNLNDKINKKINIRKEPLFQILIIGNNKKGNKVIIKYTYLINELYVEQFIKIIKNIHFKNINEPNKILDLIFEFIFYPIHIFLEIIIIFIFNFKY